MQLISINIGKERPIANAKSYGKTGIYKQPQSGLVEITPLGIPGDAIVDVKHHGGLDQALYLYTVEDYAWWSRELGQDLLPGTFGENLTVAGLESGPCLAGDRLQIGEVTLEVSCARMPCVTLAARMGDPLFVKRFNDAERPGLYCRVIQPGFIQAPSPISFTRYTGPSVSMVEMVRSFSKSAWELDYLRRFLAAPTPLKGRAEKEAELRAREEKI
jgi:MOSC domain-containing protein YiiM